MQSKADFDLHREIDELMMAGEMACKTGKSTETCPYPWESWEGGVWLDGYHGAKWDAMASEAYEKGHDASFNGLVFSPPYKEGYFSRLLESYIDGLFDGSYSASCS